MLFLLLLFIIPSAVGVYFLLKPPVEQEIEMEMKNASNVVAHFIGLEDVPLSASNPATLIRKQTVNE
jgi:hypothetical protein